LGFVIGDRSERKIKFVVDGGIGSTTAGWFFLNVTNPGEKTKGIRLPLGGPDEKRLLHYLSLWLHANFDKKQLEQIEASKQLPNVTRKELDAWHVERLLDNRRKRVAVALANAEAIRRGYDLKEFETPRCEYDASKPDNAWTVLYDGKVKAPGNHFLVWVNDQTGQCKLMPGE